MSTKKASLVEREVAKPQVLTEGLSASLIMKGSRNPSVSLSRDSSPCTGEPLLRHYYQYQNSPASIQSRSRATAK